MVRCLLIGQQYITPEEGRAGTDQHRQSPLWNVAARARSGNRPRRVGPASAVAHLECRGTGQIGKPPAPGRSSIGSRPSLFLMPHPSCLISYASSLIPHPPFPPASGLGQTCPIGWICPKSKHERGGNCLPKTWFHRDNSCPIGQKLSERATTHIRIALRRAAGEKGAAAIHELLRGRAAPVRRKQLGRQLRV